MKLVIIKYNAGNVQSVIFALERLGINPLLTDDAGEISTADKVIFPGVGEAGSTMQYLRSTGLDKLIPSLKQPVLGICLGMQLMCRYSEEANTACLGIFEQDIMKFRNPAGAEKYKIPQMGWNNIYDLKTTLFDAIEEQAYMYCVHSFYAGLGEHTIASTNYIIPYSSALRKDNFYAVQFHPEKSADSGHQLLMNFVKQIQ